MTSAGVSVIDALTDVVIGNLPTGGQPSSLAYDTRLNRLYVTEQAAGRVSVYDAAVSAGTLPSTLVVSPAGSAPGAIGVAPLPDGTRFYVLGNLAGTDLTLTRFDSATLVMINSYPLNHLNPGGAAVPPVLPLCSNTRFRFLAGAAADSARVYVSSCDAGGTYIYRTTDDSGVLFLTSPNQPPVGGGPPVPQNPVFLITGR
jgi:hypothetical protein